MTKIIKMLPIAALFLGLFFFAGNAMMKSAIAKTLTDFHWVYNPDLVPTGCTPLMAECYEKVADLSAVCEEEEDVCGIIAKEKTGNPNQPDISGDVETALETEDHTSGLIFFGPRITQN